MSIFNLAIEIGSSNTVIYKEGMGIVLKEPSLLLTEKFGKRKFIKDVGISAVKTYNKHLENFELVSPIAEGVVNDRNLARIMLQEFLKKINEKKLFNSNKIIFCIPCGLSNEIKTEFKNLAYSLNATKIELIPSVIFANIFMNPKCNDNKAKVVVVMGGGLTDIAIIANNKILVGGSTKIGGISVDKEIKQYVLNTYNLDISLTTAEEVKKEIGTLLPNDISKLTISGVSLVSNEIEELTLTSQEIRPILESNISKIVDILNNLLTNASIEIKKDVLETGINVCGGFSQITGVDRILKSRLNLNINMSYEPENAVIYGAKNAIGNDILLQDILDKNAEK